MPRRKYECWILIVCRIQHALDDDLVRVRSMEETDDAYRSKGIRAGIAKHDEQAVMFLMHEMQRNDAFELWKRGQLAAAEHEERVLIAEATGAHDRANEAASKVEQMGHALWQATSRAELQQEENAQATAMVDVQILVRHREEDRTDADLDAVDTMMLQNCGWAEHKDRRRKKDYYICAVQCTGLQDLGGAV